MYHNWAKTMEKGNFQWKAFKYFKVDNPTEQRVTFTLEQALGSADITFHVYEKKNSDDDKRDSEGGHTY